MCTQASKHAKEGKQSKPTKGKGEATKTKSKKAGVSFPVTHETLLFNVPHHRPWGVRCTGI